MISLAWCAVCLVHKQIAFLCWDVDIPSLDNGHADSLTNTLNGNKNKELPSVMHPLGNGLGILEDHRGNLPMFTISH